MCALCAACYSPCSVCPLCVQCFPCARCVLCACCVCRTLSVFGACCVCVFDVRCALCVGPAVRHSATQSRTCSATISHRNCLRGCVYDTIPSPFRPLSCTSGLIVQCPSQFPFTTFMETPTCEIANLIQRPTRRVSGIPGKMCLAFPNHIAPFASHRNAPNAWKPIFLLPIRFYCCLSVSTLVLTNQYSYQILH